jgi:Uma2 family endonuclease
MKKETVMTAVASPPRLITADDYIRMPDDGRRTELRRGVIVFMNFPGFRHGEVCSNILRLVGNYVADHRLGRTLSNDSGIITERNPDTVRGADVTFYSYQRVPKGQSPIGYAGASPEIVFEVVSPSNTRREIARKTGEYLNAGVNVVCVVDPQYKTVNLHYPDLPDKALQGDELLTFVDLPGFSAPVSRFFE